MEDAQQLGGVGMCFLPRLSSPNPTTSSFDEALLQKQIQITAAGRGTAPYILTLSPFALSPMPEQRLLQEPASWGRRGALSSL